MHTKGIWGVNFNMGGVVCTLEEAVPLVKMYTLG